MEGESFPEPPGRAPGKRPSVPLDGAAIGSLLEEQASPAAWHALYEAAVRFRDAAPWEWSRDEQLVGVSDPETGETGFCCALGAAGELFGLLVHRGARGFTAWQRLHDDGYEELDGDEACFSQDAVMVDFTARGTLPAAERARIRELGLSFRGRNAWPRVECHRPGWVPAPPDAQGVQLLRHALGQALPVFLRARSKPELTLPDAAGRRLVCTRSGSGEAARWSETREAPPDAPPLPALAQVDEITMRRLRNALPVAPVTLEFGVGWSFGGIGEPGRRGCFPLVALLVDRTSAIIVHVAVAAPPLVPQLPSDIAQAAFQETGSRPGRLPVRTEMTRAALAPLARSLDVELRREGELPALDEALSSLEAAMRRG